MCSTRTRGQCAAARYPSRDPASARGPVWLPGGVILPPFAVDPRDSHPRSQRRLPVLQDPMRVDLEGMAITFTRLD